MTIMDTLKTGYPVNFSEVPSVGTQVRYWGGSTATLKDVEPYQRADGAHSVLLVWETSYGRIGATGLRSKSMTWRTAQ